MKKIFIRIGAWLLVLVMLFSVASCSKLPNGSTDTGDTNPSTGGGPDPQLPAENLTVVAEDGSSAYTIVRSRSKSDGSNELTVSAAAETQYIIEHLLGTKLEIDSDLGKAGEYEIIIGETSREEKGLAFDRSSLNAGESLIRVIGKQILITGTDDASTERAVYEFLFRYVINREGAGIVIPSDLNLLLPADNKALAMTIAGASIDSFTIVTRAAATDMELYAAQNLQHYIMKTTGVRLEMKTDAEAQSGKEIQVGRTNRVTAANLQTGDLGAEGFIITVSGQSLIISGGEQEERGTLYGVYEFLEAYLGWQFLYDEFEICSAEQAIAIPASLTDIQTPAMDYRWYDGYPNDRYQMAKRKQNSVEDSHTALGGGWNYAGVDCHTMNMLLGRGGTIYGENPCYSSEENYEVILKNVRSWLSEHPGAELISVSMTDSETHCKCSDCKAIMQEEGGAPMGVLLRMVNRIAAAIKDEYPDVMVETLAYYDFKLCPTKTKPADNVVIRIAPLERCYQHALADPACSINAGVRSYMEDWFASAENVLIYEYGASWGDFLSPLGNIYQLYDDIRYYQSNGILGMFLLGQYMSASADFAELRNYLAAELMWDCDITRDAYEQMIKDFLKGYYGDGWESILKWLDWTEDKADNIDDCYTSYGEILFAGRVDTAVFKQEKSMLESYFAVAYAKAENYDQYKHIQILNLQYQYMDLCITFSVRYKKGGETQKALLLQNQQFFNSVQHYNVRMRESVGNPNLVSYATSPEKWV